MTEQGDMDAGSIPVVDWEQMLLVYLIDPVDKVLDLKGCESRAARYAAAALGRQSAEAADAGLDLDGIRRWVSRSEGIPLPASSVSRADEACQSGNLQVRHPMSGKEMQLQGLALDENAVVEVIQGIVRDLPDARSRFLALWRLLPERIEERLGSDFVRLPADMRMPDRTIIHQADMFSGLWASRFREHGGAHLSMSLGPVQSFISAARTVRDLWTGSAILSWLVFQGMKPILESIGPTAFVFPLLRGNSLMDLWLRRTGLNDRVCLPKRHARRSLSIPNRFVANVPWGLDGSIARRFASECEASIHSAWKQLSVDVFGRLDPILSPLEKDWAVRWRGQIEAVFDVRSSVVPERELDETTLARLVGGSSEFSAVWPDAAKVRALKTAMPENDRPEGTQQSAGLWQAQMEISARMMEATRMVRRIPSVESHDRSPPKCSLFGSFEQMGPSRMDASRAFWETAEKKLKVDSVRLRSGERLSAVAMCKRFAAPATFASALELSGPDLRFPDTATIAAASWLNTAGIDPDHVRREFGDWNGGWLHQARKDQVEAGVEAPHQEVWNKIVKARKEARPPSYYAIIMMDADEIGSWLRGERAPTVRECLHPDLQDYFSALGAAASEGLHTKRPVDPVLHAAISDALNNFATVVAPSITSSFDGRLVYSGGDDTLALVPVANAVGYARALQKAFQGVDDSDGRTAGWITFDQRSLLTMSEAASVSAGIAIVHAKEDLRMALQAAREAEAEAKSKGRNVLAISFMRKSGEHSHVLLEWELSEVFNEIVSIFGNGASDRWVYKLRALLPTLEGTGVPDSAIASEIRRLADRGDSRGDGDSHLVDGRLAGKWWKMFLDHQSGRYKTRGERLNAFTLLCQGASFVARGFDA